MTDCIYKVVVIGVSAGGMDTLPPIFKALPADFPLPIAVVQHLHPMQNRFYLDYYTAVCKLHISEALDKQPISVGNVYFAPPDYHLLVNKNMCFSLSADEKVNFSRPSIDVLFESAAEAFGAGVIAVLLTGANNDGAMGCKTIKNCDGKVIVQAPEDAEYQYMPQSAINIMQPDIIAPASDIVKYLLDIINENL